MTNPEMTLSLWNTIDQSELEQANVLVDQEYRRSGYLLPTDPSLPHIHDHFPATIVSTAKNAANSVLGTIALIPDTAQKMPIDAVFPDEISVLRPKNLKMAEIGRLAVAKLPEIPPTESKKVLPALFSTALAWSFFLKLDAIVITINPKHDPLYRHFGFQPLDLNQERCHPTLKNAPALARIVFLQNIDVQSFRFLSLHPREIRLSSAFRQGKAPLSF